MGDMADMYMWDDRDIYDDEPEPPAFKTCRYCGAGGLEWGSHEGKWRLFKAGVLHACKTNPLPKKLEPRVIVDPIEKAFRAGFHEGYRSAMSEAFPDVGPGTQTISVAEAYLEYFKLQKILSCSTDQSEGSNETSKSSVGFIIRP